MQIHKHKKLVYMPIYVKMLFFKGRKVMKTLRIKDSQQEKIRQLAITFNKRLVHMGKQPLRDSELVHALIDEALEKAMLDENGNIAIRRI
jgi:hypothetical protein